ncbi:LPXTG cell wall anchor domain-containing protein, partial [Corynebacterium sp. UBA2622]|uniref:LPXTG cell wall anchor domain-containing protein n=1 Tax=Corynebacterium sp. UBA2622 TaxID=1946393 RepID=UPI0025C68CE1
NTPGQPGITQQGQQGNTPQGNTQQGQPQKQRNGLANTGVSGMTLVWVAIGIAAVIAGAALVRRRPRSDS